LKYLTFKGKIFGVRAVGERGIRRYDRGTGGYSKSI